MDNLPTTLQGMKDYLRFARSTIKRESKRISDLQEIINILEPKIKLLKKENPENANKEISED